MRAFFDGAVVVAGLAGVDGASLAVSELDATPDLGAGLAGVVFAALAGVVFAVFGAGGATTAGATD